MVVVSLQEKKTVGNALLSNWESSSSFWFGIDKIFNERKNQAKKTTFRFCCAFRCDAESKLPSCPTTLIFTQRTRLNLLMPTDVVFVPFSENLVSQMMILPLPHPCIGRLPCVTPCRPICHGLFFRQRIPPRPNHHHHTTIHYRRGFWAVTSSYGKSWFKEFEEIISIFFKKITIEFCPDKFESCGLAPPPCSILMSPLAFVCPSIWCFVWVGWMGVVRGPCPTEVVTPEVVSGPCPTELVTWQLPGGEHKFTNLIFGAPEGPWGKPLSHYPPFFTLPSQSTFFHFWTAKLACGSYMICCPVLLLGFYTLLKRILWSSHMDTKGAEIWNIDYPLCGSPRCVPLFLMQMRRVDFLLENSFLEKAVFCVWSHFIDFFKMCRHIPLFY